jgi:hypothetical protein
MGAVRKIQSFFQLAAALLMLLLTMAIPAISLADALATQNRAAGRQAGKVIEVKDGMVTMLLTDGAITRIPWTAVSRLAIYDRVAITLTSGEKINGLLTLDGPDVRLVSPTLGPMQFPKEKILLVERRQMETMPAPVRQEYPQLAAVRGRGTKSPPPDPQEDNSQEELAAPDQKKKEVPAIGVKPEERVAEEAFLRREKVLLPQGSLEAEAGLAYSDNASYGLLGYKDRSLIFPLTARLGLTDKLLTFVTVPLALSWRETPGPGKSSFQQLTGLGDVRFGFQYQLLTERVRRPDLMFSLTARTDTGKSPYAVPDTAAPLGTGHWQIEPGVSLVKTYDPVVFFGSLSYTHFFPGHDRQPGDAINPTIGTGFALNDEVAMSFRVVGSYILRSKEFSQEYGRVLTPFSFVFTVDKYLTKNSYLEPSVGFGLTDEAPDFTAMLLYVHRFSLWK